MVVLMGDPSRRRSTRTSTGRFTRRSSRAPVVAGLFVWCVCAFAPPVAGLGPARPPSAAGQPGAPVREIEVVEIEAERFRFTPSEVHVTAGRIVEFRLRSHDTNHGFHILGTDVDLIIPKRGRGTAVVRFPVEAPGRYTFECSKLCGAGHSFMRGTLIVTE